MMIDESRNEEKKIYKGPNNDINVNVEICE